MTGSSTETPGLQARPTMGAAWRRWLRGCAGLAALAAGGCATMSEYDERTAELRDTRARLDRAMALAEEAGSQRDQALQATEACTAQARSIEEYFGKAGGPQAVQAALTQARDRRLLEERQRAERAQLTLALRDELSAGTVRLDERLGELRVVLPAEALFEGSALSTPGRKTAAAVGGELAKLPTRRLLVAGHGSDAGKAGWTATSTQARLIAEALLGAGVVPGRIAIAGHGDTDPLAAPDSDDGKRRNRRVEIVLLSTPDFIPPPPPTKPTKPATPAKKGAAAEQKPVLDDPGLLR